MKRTSPGLYRSRYLGRCTIVTSRTCLHAGSSTVLYWTQCCSCASAGAALPQPGFSLQSRPPAGTNHRDRYLSKIIPNPRWPTPFWKISMPIEQLTHPVFLNFFFSLLPFPNSFTSPFLWSSYNFPQKEKNPTLLPSLADLSAESALRVFSSFLRSPFIFNFSSTSL